MFTSGQVSEILGVPGASVRRYVRQFSDHLSEGAYEAEADGSRREISK